MSDEKIDAVGEMELAAELLKDNGYPESAKDLLAARDAVDALIGAVDGVATHLIGYGEVAEFASRYLRDALDRVRSS